MAKIWLFIIGLLLCTIVIQAQISVTSTGSASIAGKVIDSISRQGLEYATVTLLDQQTGKTVTGSTSGGGGEFVLDNLAIGEYQLVIESIGYRKSTLSNLRITKKAVLIDLKNIPLSKQPKTLTTVIVTAQTKLIDNRIDKLVYNAEKDITSQGGVATDVLKKVPQVSVDVDGNVELAGSASVRFLINGKPSSAFGSSITDVLQSIPASQIKSIEVITNPGAKYDAQGLGGIINIILKQNTARGINGNLSLTAGSRNENGSFNFNARSGNFGFNAFLSGNARLAAITANSSLRTTSDSAGNQQFLSQNGNNRFLRHGIETGIGFDWTFKKQNNFTGSFNLNDFRNSGTGFLSQLQSVHNYIGNQLSDILSQNITGNSNDFQNADISLNYRRSFEKEDQELTVEINSSLGNSEGISNNDQYFLPGDSLYYGIRARNPGKENETEVKVDYNQPIAKDVLIGIGAKATFLDITSNSALNKYSVDDKSYLPDSSLSSALTYRQKVYALYAEISFPVSKFFDVKLGSRYERTQTKSFYARVQSQVQVPGYNTVVPSIFFSKKLAHDQVIKLGYSKRIERPDYGDLNPFINTSDPKNIVAGNPYLQPEVGQRFELSYSRDFPIGSFMITAFYRNNRHDIQPYLKYYNELEIGDSIYRNVSVSTRENIGSEKNTGINVFANLRVTPKLSIRSNIFLFHRHIKNEIDKGLDRYSFNYRLNVNGTYQFSNLLAGELFGNFNSARNEAQGKYPSFTTYNIALRKLSANKKVSFALTATNPFNKYVNQRLELYGVNFTQSSLRKIPFRSFGINFTWKFGKLEFKKDNEEPAGEVNAPQGS